jgi:two-component system, OmpR family, sensor histidine kinase KdpD
VSRTRIDLRRLLSAASVALAALAVVTIAVAWLEGPGGVPNASATYLLAVVVVAVAFGTTPAVITAVGSFLVYDFLFIEPRFTFTVRDPGEWLNLLLLLLIGTVVGRLAGRERDRAERALAGEREARALFNVSFALAERRETGEALRAVAATVRAETRMARVWIALGETVAADTAAEAATATPAVHVILRRRPGDEPAEWVRVHAPTRGQSAGRDREETTYRVVITAGDRTYGSLWGSRPRTLGDPDPGETRVLAAAADQLGGSLERDRLARDATSAEISRRSDALKSALLDSVSHDLRTPLAAVLGAATSLRDDGGELSARARRELADTIAEEASHLNRLVGNVLDVTRLESGTLILQKGWNSMEEIVGTVIGRLESRLGSREIRSDIPLGLPLVLMDDVLFGQLVMNLVENALRYTPEGTPIEISARIDSGDLRFEVADRGPGLADGEESRIFDKGRRGAAQNDRHGAGLGLTIVRGIAEAHGGRIEARNRPGGGAGFVVRIPAGSSPPAIETDRAIEPA